MCGPPTATWTGSRAHVAAREWVCTASMFGVAAWEDSLTHWSWGLFLWLPCCFAHLRGTHPTMVLLVKAYCVLCARHWAQPGAMAAAPQEPVSTSGMDAPSSGREEEGGGQPLTGKLPTGHICRGLLVVGLRCRALQSAQAGHTPQHFLLREAPWQVCSD